MNASRATGTPRESVAEARAAAQAAARERRGLTDAARDRHFATHPDGRAVVVTSVAVTALFVVVSLVAGLVDTSTARRVAALFDLVVFAAGLVLFVAALVAGARRSRHDAMTMSGWFFLAGSAPPGTRRALLGSLVVQIAVGLGTAAWRPFTAMAFGVLVATFGVAVCGWWGARFGWFPSLERRRER